MVGILNIMVWTGWSRLIWHNIIKIADNWIKICRPVLIWTCNNCVTFGQKFSTVWGKCQNTSGGIFWLTLYKCLHGFTPRYLSDDCQLVSRHEWNIGCAVVQSTLAQSPCITNQYKRFGKYCSVRRWCCRIGHWNDIFTCSCGHPFLHQEMANLRHGCCLQRLRSRHFRLWIYHRQVDVEIRVERNRCDRGLDPA